MRDLHDTGILQLNTAGLSAIARDYSARKVRADLLARWERIILSEKQNLAA
jgi:hypothetical protein